MNSRYSGQGRLYSIYILLICARIVIFLYKTLFFFFIIKDFKIILTIVKVSQMFFVLFLCLSYSL